MTAEESDLHARLKEVGDAQQEQQRDADPGGHESAVPPRGGIGRGRRRHETDPRRAGGQRPARD